MKHPSPISGVSVGLSASLCVFALSVPASAQVTPYGSGVNPAGSLVVTSGIPMVGERLTVGVSNTASASAPASLAFLSLATAPDAAFPAGTVLPGFGLSTPGAPGELLLSSIAPNPLVVFGPKPWAGGATPPAEFVLGAPLVPALAGLTLYLQGTLLDLVTGPSLGLTNALAVTLAAPDFPGLVPIPAGTFQIGSTATSGAPYFGESGATKPVHQVTISRPFWMGRYEVTQAEFEAVTNENPSEFVGPNLPVHGVSWDSAKSYAYKLNAQQTALGKVPAGYEYRLPTEAEWEYACRAGTTTEFSYGPELLCDQANFGYSFHSTPAASCSSAGPAPVGSFAPNAWGLYDMHGNVWEWCADKFWLYTAAPKTDPYATFGDGRVVRGGNWGMLSSQARSAYRISTVPENDYKLLGFRIVLGPVLP